MIYHGERWKRTWSCWAVELAFCNMSGWLLAWSISTWSKCIEQIWNSSFAVVSSCLGHLQSEGPPDLKKEKKRCFCRLRCEQLASSAWPKRNITHLTSSKARFTETLGLSCLHCWHSLLPGLPHQNNKVKSYTYFSPKISLMAFPTSRKFRILSNSFSLTSPFPLLSLSGLMSAILKI